MISVTKSHWPCPVRTDVELAGFTTMGVGGKVPLLLEPRNCEEIVAAVRQLRAEGIPFRTLGGGANLLIDDLGLDEAILLTENVRHVMRDGDGITVLRLGCGMPIPTFVQQTREMGLTGAECLVGIPGTMGGATAMNAGGRHGWLSAIVRRVRVLTKDGEDIELEKNDAMFGYRSSIFGDAIVLETIVELEPGNRTLIQDRIKTILKEKSVAQPLTQKSAGCIFKNPEGGSAGKSIEAAGLKGLRIGGAEVSTKHANFIVNLDAAKFADVAALIRKVREEVHAHSGIHLEREVKLWSREPGDL